MRGNCRRITRYSAEPCHRGISWFASRYSTWGGAHCFVELRPRAVTRQGRSQSAGSRRARHYFALQVIPIRWQVHTSSTYPLATQPLRMWARSERATVNEFVVAGLNSKPRSVQCANQHPSKGQAEQQLASAPKFGFPNWTARIGGEFAHSTGVSIIREATRIFVGS
jgi:hypothetical protein